MPNGKCYFANAKCFSASCCQATKLLFCLTQSAILHNGKVNKFESYTKYTYRKK